MLDRLLDDEQLSFEAITATSAGAVNAVEGGQHHLPRSRRPFAHSSLADKARGHRAYQHDLLQHIGTAFEARGLWCH